VGLDIKSSGDPRRAASREKAVLPVSALATELSTTCSTPLFRPSSTRPHVPRGPTLPGEGPVAATPLLNLVEASSSGRSAMPVVATSSPAPPMLDVDFLASRSAPSLSGTATPTTFVASTPALDHLHVCALALPQAEPAYQPPPRPNRMQTMRPSAFDPAGASFPFRPTFTPRKRARNEGSDDDAGRAEADVRGAPRPRRWAGWLDWLFGR